ncbi:hypothetical protein ABFX02_06G049400 [Erythranthe guttata]
MCIPNEISEQYMVLLICLCFVMHLSEFLRLFLSLEVYIYFLCYYILHSGLVRAHVGYPYSLLGKFFVWFGSILSCLRMFFFVVQKKKEYSFVHCLLLGLIIKRKRIVMYLN